jgi:magnesium transporter
MIRLKYHVPGTPPGALVHAHTPASTESKISLIQYDEQSIYEAQFDSFDELIERYDPAKVNWINIDGLGDVELMRRLGEKFSLHPLALEDVLNTTQRPKVEHYGDHFFIVSEMLYFSNDEELLFEQVSIFLGESFVITLQEECGKDVFDPVRHRLRSGRGFLRARKTDYLVYTLLDGIVDQFFPVLESIGDGIEELEDALIERPNNSTLRQLHEAKRLLLQVRRASWPQREVLSTLMRDDTGRIQHDTQIFLRDCYDHITQIIDIIESYRDLTAGLMDLYLSSVGMRTNEIMRVLTLVSTMFIPLTFLAGVYGMNFDTDSPYNMPELKMRYGYLGFWVVAIVIATAMYIWMKRRKWL